MHVPQFLSSFNTSALWICKMRISSNLLRNERSLLTVTMTVSRYHSTSSFRASLVVTVECPSRAVQRCHRSNTVTNSVCIVFWQSGCRRTTDLVIDHCPLTKTEWNEIRPSLKFSTRSDRVQLSFDSRMLCHSGVGVVTQADKIFRNKRWWLPSRMSWVVAVWT